MTEKTVLKTENLTKNFGGITAVDSVDIEFTEGKLRALIGPNGAGKTTFFNLLSGVLKPTEGKVIYQGEEITNYSPEERSQKGIARSFQLTQIFPSLTAFENVRLAAQSRGDKSIIYNIISKASNYDEFVEKAMDLLERVDLRNQANTLASNLTRADQRKLDVTMAIATEPDLLLLDEPTSGMAVEEIPEILDVIDKLSETRENLTTLLIEHKMDIVMDVSEEILVLADGKVLADGTPEEIKQSQEVQKAYLGALG